MKRVPHARLVLRLNCQCEGPDPKTLPLLRFHALIILPGTTRTSFPVSARKHKQGWASLNEQIIACERCPRLREHCRLVAEKKRKSFAEWDYWGRPVPNLGEVNAQLLIVGLAPAAHGANRTGRMFTGDRSGDWLYAAMYEAGFANMPTSVSMDDGLQLIDSAITAACHCAPPDNRPTREELTACQSWLDDTVELLNPRVIIGLGQIGWRSALDVARRRAWHAGKLPKFGHGAITQLDGHGWLIASYHPSQQNTFTGRLTREMLRNIFETAQQLLNE